MNEEGEIVQFRKEIDVISVFNKLLIIKNNQFNFITQFDRDKRKKTEPKLNKLNEVDEMIISLKEKMEFLR